MAFNVSYVYQAIDKFTPVANKIKRSVDGITNSVTHSTNTVNRMGEALNRMRGRIALVGAAAAGLGLRHLVQYETALLGVAKTADIEVGQALDNMGAKFRKLSLQSPISVIELLNFGQSAAQMGVVGEENILNFANTMGKLTRASNIMGEEGASQLARLINLTRGNISEVENYASSLVALGNTSAATEGEILEFATQLSGAGALFGITGTQAIGLATAMRVLGIQSEVGSSVLGRSLGVVNKAIRSNSKELILISNLTGIAAKDLKEKFAKDAVSVVAKLGAGLEDLEKRGGDVTSALGFLGLEGIRDIRVLGSLAQNTTLVTEKMNLASKAFQENTALQREFDIQSKSLANSWQLFKNAIGETALIIGDVLMPAMKGMLNLVTSLIKGINFILKNPLNILPPVALYNIGKEYFANESNIQSFRPEGLTDAVQSALSGGITAPKNINNTSQSMLSGNIIVSAAQGSKVESTNLSTKGNVNMSLGMSIAGAY